MTTFPFSAKLQKLIHKELASGNYVSEEQMMVAALDALADRRRAIEGIRRGLDDVAQGRLRSWDKCKRDLIQRHPHLASP